MLFCNNAPRDSLHQVSIPSKTTRSCRPHRSKQRVHELVKLLRRHHVLALDDTHRLIGYYRQMFLERFSDDSAVAIIIFHRFDFFHPPQRLKSFVVQFVDVGHMRVADDDEG